MLSRANKGGAEQVRTGGVQESSRPVAMSLPHSPDGTFVTLQGQWGCPPFRKTGRQLGVFLDSQPSLGNALPAKTAAGPECSGLSGAGIVTPPTLPRQLHRLPIRFWS